MPMDGNVLGALIAAAKVKPGMSASEIADLETEWKENCTIIINYIVANMQLNGASCTGATGAGTPGGPLPITAQPVTGGVI